MGNACLRHSVCVCIWQATKLANVVLHMPVRPEALSGKRRPSMFTRATFIQGVELQRNLKDIAPSWHFLVSNSSNNPRCLEVVEAFLDAHEDSAQVYLSL